MELASTGSKDNVLQTDVYLCLFLTKLSLFVQVNEANLCILL